MTAAEITAALGTLRWQVSAQQSAIARGGRVTYRLGRVEALKSQISALEALAASLRDQAAAPPGVAPTVRSAAELAAAVADRETDIILAAGSYGALVLDRTDGVSIRAPAGADFESISLTGAQGTRLEGLRWGALSAVRHWQGRAVEGLELVDCTSRRCFVRDALDVDVLRGDYTGAVALTYFDVSGGSVRDAYIHHATEDCLRLFGRTSGIVVEGCRIEDCLRPPGSQQHPDLLQVAHASTGECPHDLVIRRNFLTDDAATGATIGQGIFLGGPYAPAGFRNILVEENLLAVPHPQGIYVTGGAGEVIIRNNTMIPNSAGDRANIRAAQNPYSVAEGMSNAGVLIERNICATILNEGPLARATVRDNILLPARRGWAETFPGRGLTRADFIPLPSAGIGDDYGATAWLKSIL